MGPWRPERSALDEAEQASLVRWHEAAYRELSQRGPVSIGFLGLRLDVAASVFAPTRMSDLLGSLVEERVRPGSRVLDMGTGSGVNALLAARAGGRVVGVDVNPEAVACAAANAARNGLAGRCEFRVSDVFHALLPEDGPFDVVVFDPPYRWLPARDAVELAVTDEGYTSLSRFLDGVTGWLATGGEVLMSFGTTGDLRYLRDTASANGLVATVHRTRELQRAGRTVRYEAFSLVPQAPPRGRD